MPDESPDFLDILAEGDAAKIRSQMKGKEFVLISMSDGTDEGDDEEDSGALTAEIDGCDALVVFTTEPLAGQFVQDQSDLFEDVEEVEGLVVEGDALLEYLPEGFGMLFDPEVAEGVMVDPELAGKIAAGV